MCRSKSSIRAVATAADTESSDEFLGVIQVDTATVSQDWTTTASLNESNLNFKIDTGADVTVIPERSEAKYGPLEKASEKLKGAGQQALDVSGKFQAKLVHNDTRSKQ